MHSVLMFFCFQAEDGIRDGHVTGVQTCALPISSETVIDAPVELELPQTSSTIKNYGGSTCDPSGEMPLHDALRISCNTAFADLGMELGAEAMLKQSTAFRSEERRVGREWRSTGT